MLKFWFSDQNVDILGEIFGFEIKICQNFGFSGQTISQFWFFDENLDFLGQRFGFKVEICHNFRVRSKFTKMLVFRSKSVKICFFQVKVYQKFGFLMKTLIFGSSIWF